MPPTSSANALRNGKQIDLSHSRDPYHARHRLHLIPSHLILSTSSPPPQLRISASATPQTSSAPSYPVHNLDLPRPGRASNPPTQPSLPNPRTAKTGYIDRYPPVHFPLMIVTLQLSYACLCIYSDPDLPLRIWVRGNPAAANVPPTPNTHSTKTETKTILSHPIPATLYVVYFTPPHSSPSLTLPMNRPT